MAKTSLALVFALVVTVQLHSVLCQDQDPWKAVIDEATKAGLSQDTINQAEKAIGDGTAAKAAEEALGGASLNDWVQQANDMANGGNSPAGAPQNLPDDEEEDNLKEAPELAPKSAPLEAPTKEPKLTPKTTNAPAETPTEAPQAQTPIA